MIEGRTIFLTGGAGFIGATIIEHLVERNRIVAFDNLQRDSLSSRAISSHPNLTLIRGDVLDGEALARAMRESDPHIVVHLAAVAGIETVLRSPTTTMRVNLVGTINALAAAQTLPHLERFVDFSTSEVFGTMAFRVEEAQQTMIGAVGEARWIYAVSKLAGEHLAHAYHKEFGLPTVTLRPFNVYGPGQVGEGAIHRFIVAALEGRPLEIHGDGTQIRAWCYVDDMIDGVLLAMEHPGAVGHSFNIGNARAVVTIYGLANTILRVLDSKAGVVFARKDYADIELRVPNVEKARELIGFEAKVDLEEGLRRTAAFYRKKAGDRAVKAFRSHGTGEIELEKVRAMGSNVIFEPGAMMFHPESISIGNNVYVGHYAILKGYHRNAMVIGDNVWIGQHCFLHSAGGLSIGNNVGIGPGVYIHTARHAELGREIPIVFAGVEDAPVVIEDDADLGIRSIILPGVRVGRGAQVGAGAVVTHDVPAYGIVAGVPARLLRLRPE